MKYVLVTGANGGMGLAVVKRLLKEGYFVFALDKNIDNLSFVEGNIMALQADVTDIASIREAFDKVRATTDCLYSVLHFAGIYLLDSLVEVDEKKFLNAFQVNFFGVFRINEVFFSLLKKGSRILIATSELAPLDPLPFTGIYALTKSVLDKYAYSLRMEVQLKGIDVCVLRPGAVRTDMLDVSMEGLESFCANTKLYTCNAVRFKKVVESVESKNVPPQKVAVKVAKILSAKRPKYLYKINRNPLLLLLNALPKRWQTGIIRNILK